MFLSLNQLELCEFCGTVKAERHTDCANTAIDIKLHVAELELTSDILPSHGWEDKRPQSGQANLAAMGVPGEHQVDQRKSGMPDDGICVVRFVDHQDDRSTGIRWNSDVEIRYPIGRIVGSSDIESVVATFEREEAVNEDRGAVGFERLDDTLRSYGNIVIAEDGEALGSLEP